MRITALVASHNRRESTLACLRSFFSQELDGWELDAVLVDDGSRDGTGEAVAELFDAVELVNGDGTLYWAASMASAEAVALARRPEALLWLNDDVVLDLGALAALVDVCAGDSIVVGALRDPESGALTYSGVRRRDWHPLRMELVQPGDEPVEVETFNGNVVLVPASAASRIGPIDGAFAHAAADFDYGLRAAELGVARVLAPGTVGTCRRDDALPPWLDGALPLRSRLAALLGPKGVPPRSSARYLRRHGGPLWPLFWAATYVKFALGSGSGRQLAQHAAGIPRGDDSGRDVAGDHASGADHRPGADPRAGQHDGPRSHEDVVLDHHVASWAGGRGVPPRHDGDRMEVRVGDDDVCSEQDSLPDLDRPGRADRGSAQAAVGAHAHPRSLLQGADHDGMGDSERRVAGPGDQRNPVAEPDRRAASPSHDRPAAQPDAGAEVDAERTQLGQPEQGETSLDGEGRKSTEIGHRRSSGERTRGVGGVVLLGPASPRDLAGLLSGRDRELAAAITGYRGIPVSELAKALVEAGLSVELATTATEVDSPLTLEGPRFRLHVVPMRARARDRALTLFARERKELLASLAATEGGVVHAHWTYEFAWVALDSGRPAVVTAHDAPLTIVRHYRDAYRAIRTAMAYTVRLRTGTLTAVSPYLAGRWRREMGYRGPIAVVPNVAPALPSVDAARNGHVRIVDIADSGRHKNVRSLVRAFHRLREHTPDLELDLVGSGLGAGESFSQELEREGVDGGIAFRGVLEREELSRVLAGAHVFVHPSREECCSTAVLEAMRAGLPVVAGRTAGGTPWMLDAGHSGLLVDVRDPDAIAGAVAGLLADPELAARLSERARRRVEDVFSPTAVAAAYLDVYERALARAA